MDTEDYTQHELSVEDLEGQAQYLTESLDGIVTLRIDGAVRAIELPAPVVLAIVETAPASACTKSARLSTGLEIQVPEYLEAGERVKVNTETGKYMPRA